MATAISTNTGSSLEAGGAAALRAATRGEVLLPGEPGYDEARSVWNAMIDRRPAAILRAREASDVIAGVNFARQHGLPLSIKGGGHNIAGLAVCDGGLTLDMSPMKGVQVDLARRTARVQAGCLLGDVDRATQAYGLAAVLGFVSNTGAAGLTLGGGFGYLTRQYGWSCDNVLSMEVITAGGELVTASASQNPDLFWGLRGGGGNFGVVTGFEYQLHPVGPQVTAGAVAWPAEQMDEVLAMYRNLVRQAPPELTCAAILRMAPAAPWLPEAVHGKPVVMLMACHTGPVEVGQRETAAIKAFGASVGDILQPRPYTSQQSLLDATQPKGRRYYWKSEYLAELAPEMLAKSVEYAARSPSPYSGIILFPVDGALNHLPGDYSPMGNRDARMVLNITAAWDKAPDDAANIEWARSAWRDLRRFSTGGTYINFQTADEGADRVAAAYGQNYDRLAAVKTRWDPDNLFRVNKNIAPRPA